MSLIPVYILAFIVAFGQSSVSPVLAIYASHMGASHSMVGGIISVWAATQLITQVPAGKFADRIGRKRLVLGGLVSTSLLALVYHLADSPAQFLALQAAAGLAAGSFWPSILAHLADLSPARSRGKAMGTFNTIHFAGIGAGPLLGSFAAQTFGDSSVFNIWSGMAALGAVFAAVAFKEITKKPAPTPIAPAPSEQTFSGAIFQAKTEKVKLLKPGYWPTFMSACVIRSRGGFCQSFNNSMLPLYAVALFAATEPMIGALMSIHAVMLAVFNIPGGMLTDRWGRKRLALIGAFMATAGVLWYSFPGEYWTLLVAVGLAGAGSAFSNPALGALTGDISHPQRRAEAYGYFLTSMQLGIVSGALLYGVLADVIGLRYSVLAWGLSSLGLSTVGFLLKETMSPRRTAAE